MKLDTLELCILQIAILQLLQDEIKKHDLDNKQSADFSLFVLAVSGPARKFVLQNMGKMHAKGYLETLLNLATTLADEIEQRSKAAEGMKE